MQMQFNFYFSVDKTQRSLTAAIGAEVLCRNDTSSQSACIPKYATWAGTAY